MAACRSLSYLLCRSRWACVIQGAPFLWPTWDWAKCLLSFFSVPSLSLERIICRQAPFALKHGLQVFRRALFPWLFCSSITSATSKKIDWPTKKLSSSVWEERLENGLLCSPYFLPLSPFCSFILLTLFLCFLFS